MIRGRLSRSTLLALLPGVLPVVWSAPLAGQERGLLFGIVVDDRSDAPIAGAKVRIVGGDAEAATDAHGMFVLAELPVGRVHLRAEKPGYSTVVEQVGVGTTALVDLEIRLVPTVVFLRELSVTAGRTRKGTAYSVTEVSTEGGTGASALDLLAAQVPGLRVAAGRGVLGQDATVGIRGVGTINGSGAPLIYLDGIRISDHVTNAVPSGVNALSVLAQIPAAEVRRIFVLRGAASAMYPDAADGVIVIETSRGR